MRRLKVSGELIAKVQQLRLGGLSQERAWRALADDSACPPDLAAFLRLTAKIPPSFFAASRLTKERWLVVHGNGFTQIVHRATKS